MKILEVLKQVISNLETLDIPSMLVGSITSSAYTRARYTQDADFVVPLSPDKIEKFVKMFGGDFYVDRGQIEQAITAESSFNIIHFKTSFKIDFFMLRNDEFSRQEFSRRSILEVGEEVKLQVSVQTAEDSLLSKLVWYRKGGEISENQWRDVIGILEVQAGRLDLGYLQKWAGELGVSDLLERARLEVET